MGSIPTKDIMFSKIIGETHAFDAFPYEHPPLEASKIEK